MKVDLNLFTVFDAIYRAGNITAAAKYLNLSQPAVSHALARLRDNFNDPLFIRQGNLMQPTPVTNSVIGDVQEALQQLQVTLAKSKKFDALTSKKHYALSLHSSLEAFYLPQLMLDVKAQAPLITIASSRIKRTNIENKLANGDIAIAVDVLLPLSDKVKHTPLTQDKLVVVSSNNNTNVSESLDIKTYLTLQHVLVSSRFSGPSIEDFELGRLGFHRIVTLRCQHYFTACRIVANNDMLLTLPMSTAQQMSKLLPLLIHPLPVTLPNIDVHLYWHENVDKEPANIWLRNKINNVAKNQ